MADTELPWSVFGRKIRPFALAVSIATFVVFMQNILTNQAPGLLGSSLQGDAVGIASAVSVVLFFVGFWARSDRAMEYALLLAAGVWSARAAFIWLEESWDNASVWLSVAWIVGSAGAWLLERTSNREWKLRHTKGTLYV